MVEKGFITEEIMAKPVVEGQRKWWTEEGRLVATFGPERAKNMRVFWQRADEIYTEVDGWPDWKKSGTKAPHLP